MLSTRATTIADVLLLRRLIQELAEYERESQAVLIPEEELSRDGFGPDRKFRATLRSRMDNRLVLRSSLTLIPLGQALVCSWRTSSCERPTGMAKSGTSVQAQSTKVLY